MIATLWRAAGLLGVYLLVTTSTAPGDVLVGGLLGLAIAGALRPHRGHRRRGAPLPARAAALAAIVAETLAEIVRGTWRTVRFCLGAPAAPGTVEIPRGDRSRVAVALWGVLTGEAPDEIVVDVDEERGVLITHLVDASDPDAVRARHARSRERQRLVIR